MIQYDSNFRRKLNQWLELAMVCLCFVPNVNAKQHAIDVSEFVDFCPQEFADNGRFLPPNLATFKEKTWAFQRLNNKPLSSTTDLQAIFTHSDQNGDQQLSLLELAAQREHARETYESAHTKSKSHRGTTLRLSHR